MATDPDPNPPEAVPPSAAPGLVLTGTVWPVIDTADFHIDDLPGWQPGDVCLGRKLDGGGRRAVKSGREDGRRSGYLSGHLLQGQGRRNIRNWKALFPNRENIYPHQGAEAEAEARVRRVLEGLRGCRCRKVIGGWEIDVPPRP